MSNDFYSDAAAQRLRMLDAERAAHLADLAAHRANGDTESAATVVQALANAEAERGNLLNLYNAYVQSQQPPQPEQLTDAERFSRPWDKMTPDDGLALAKTSKYGRDLNWNDPNVRAGYAETQKRRARGE
jgi:hypothetical protein